MPFYNLSFMLIAAAGLLTGNFNRRGHNKRVVATVLIMAAVQVAALSVDNLCMRNLYFVPLIYVLAIAPIFVCLYVLKHAGEFKFDGLKKCWAKCMALKQKLSKERSSSKA